MDGTKHHPLLVTLHWLLAALVAAMLGIGFLWLRPMPNADPHKLAVLGLHMAGGVLVLVILSLRLALRPLAARSRVRRHGHVAGAAHYALYILLVLIPATGAATAIRARLPFILLHGGGASLSARFTIIPAFIAHTLLAELLVLLIAAHVASALFHQFVLKDGTLSLMSFGAAARVRPAAPVDPSVAD
ncbi:MAG TPA: cytochrome b/b6 domain-containing protein [Allosphingosinicella sp.]